MLNGGQLDDIVASVHSYQLCVLARRAAGAGIDVFSRRSGQMLTKRDSGHAPSSHRFSTAHSFDEGHPVTFARNGFWSVAFKGGSRWELRVCSSCFTAALLATICFSATTRAFVPPTLDKTTTRSKCGRCQGGTDIRGNSSPLWMLHNPSAVLLSVVSATKTAAPSLEPRCFWRRLRSTRTRYQLVTLTTRQALQPMSSDGPLNSLHTVLVLYDTCYVSATPACASSFPLDLAKIVGLVPPKPKNLMSCAMHVCSEMAAAWKCHLEHGRLAGFAAERETRGIGGRTQGRDSENAVKVGRASSSNRSSSVANPAASTLNTRPLLFAVLSVRRARRLITSYWSRRPCRLLEFSRAACSIAFTIEGRFAAKPSGGELLRLRPGSVDVHWSESK
ncbi:hypothetical protein CMUS01_01239 [Colletotrichum musicola]|uniref:Uncharacterized protein n=1 Tax=Colletotrichum musicola TaxID=2175873 RepID=A0A8H6NX62_9PEZI|nr:hypothetical protein CMUS01_01239 [Colletotrichum musicola]